MRVLLVNHHYPPDAVGGVERITQAFAADLTQLGDTVAVATRRFSPNLPPFLMTDTSPEGADIYRLTGGRYETAMPLRWHSELEQLFEQVLAETKPEVVHVLHLRGQSPRFLELARRAGAAVVVSLYDYYFACPRVVLVKRDGEWCAGPDGGRECAATCFADEGAQAQRWRVRAQYWAKLLGSADRIICPAGFVADFFARHGADSARIRLLPNGVALPPREWHDTVPLPEHDRLRLLFLGTVLPHKGVHLILEALERAQVGNVDLVVAGSALNLEYVSQLREQAAEIPGLRMRLYGEYEVAELPMLMHGVDCVVTPSAWHEAYGIVTREALHQGVPVIVSRVGGLGEAVREGENGFTFSPQQPEELAAIFERLVNEPDLLPRLREGARATHIGSTLQHAREVREIHVEAMNAARDAPIATDAVMKEEFREMIAEGFSG